MFAPSVHTAMLWVLASILCTQIYFSPALLSALFFIAFVLRYISYKKQWVLAKMLVLLWVVLALAVVYLSYQTFLGVDAGVATLSIFLFAKVLESKTRRDALVVFNFALFVSASSFLYSQSIWMTLAVFICALSGLLGLYRIQISPFVHDKKHTLRTDAGQVLKVMLYASPFFILLFLFFPRLPPLWHIPVPSGQASTGMSDQMSPGDIAQLSQSSALAFRILGDMSSLPPRSQMYWRAMVLDRYDGRTWRSSGFNQQIVATDDPPPSQVKLRYQYLTADPNIMWIMGLEQSIPLQNKYLRRQDGSIVADRLQARIEPISLGWIGNSLPRFNANVQQRILNINTQIIADSDPKTAELAQQLWLQSQQQPTRYIEQVLNWYKSQGFVYTLNPGYLDQHRVDAFLFEAKKGFCEHYASSFVTLMRHAGLPARVVVGYQGGQWAPDAQSWEVRQLDAHAWAEVWLNGQWQRIDPTAMIAPRRIDTGMQQYLDEQQQVGSEQDVWNYQRSKWLKNARVWSDYVGYQWQSKVVGYDVNSQQNWLQKMGLHASWNLSAILIGSLTSIALLYVLILYLRARSKISRYERTWMKFEKKLPKNQHKQYAETRTQWLKRLSEQVSDAEKLDFIMLAEHDQIYRYAPNAIDQAEKKLDLLLKKCANALKKTTKSLS